MLIGHRGVPLTATENSIDSLRAAFTAGLDGIETDVQRSRDGVLLLHHDPYLPDGRFIAKLTYEEVSAAAPHVPRLAELFDLLASTPGVVANLEVKTDVPFKDERPAELAAALGRLADEVRERVWVSSFDPILLLRLQACDPGVPLAFIVSFAPALSLLHGLPVAAVHPHKRLVDRNRLRRWRERGLKVFPWTVNDRTTARELLELGVDGLVGDDPATLLHARSELHSR